jgi:hypothetical protein
VRLTPNKPCKTPRSAERRADPPRRPGRSRYDFMAAIPSCDSDFRWHARHRSQYDSSRMPDSCKAPIEQAVRSSASITDMRKPAKPDRDFFNFLPWPAEREFFLRACPLVAWQDRRLWIGETTGRLREQISWTQRLSVCSSGCASQTLPSRGSVMATVRPTANSRAAPDETRS